MSPRVSALPLSRRAVAELLGATFLLTVIVGSGIMAERLADGNDAIALLANALATGTGLAVLILTFSPVSGAHLNPAVTLADAAASGLPWREVPIYVAAQIGGAFLGVGAAHLMFCEPLFASSLHTHTGDGQYWSEFVATFGLLAVIRGCRHTRKATIPLAVGAYITSAYWFTASTSFANPAVTLARAATNTFTGIRPVDVPPFVVAQLLGAGAATLLMRWINMESSRNRPTAVPRKEQESI